ncbi:hypothetical protein [Vitiosangium sp. GDMCC 1.1324]|uniref:hypothetical protein n=1 Tax=Vitiosangium sp. (strain GDMCC 1.1324) TaxID=2138576 RepID=UPI000D3C9212|nr:hypothetical protein [Vitiosangium sp. GDMCC 1.1324]PTL75248.1 hypothetical protein DAT35_55925 [Vitiosangium sp. GDMCC 1.1324]
MNSQQLLARLQDTSAEGPLDRLAALVVEHELSQPLETLFPPALVARALKTALEGWLASDTADRELASAIEHLHRQLTQDPRTVREAVPPELSKGLAELAARRYSPDRALVLAVVDRPPVRSLARGLLLNVLIEFSRKVSAPVTENRIAKGFSGLAKLAADQARSSGGALGGIASALSDEIERQVEKRARDFTDSALSGIFQQFADALTDPNRASEQAEMRVAILDGVLGQPLARLGRELSRVDVPGGVAVVRKGLSQWLASKDATAELEGWLTRAMERNGKRPVREVLGTLGLLDTFQKVGRDALRGRLAPIVASEPFARWLETLMTEETPNGTRG